VAKSAASQSAPVILVGLGLGAMRISMIAQQILARTTALAEILAPTPFFARAKWVGLGQHARSMTRAC